MMDEKVAIITINLNDNNETLRCLHSIKKSTYQNTVAIVIDHSRTDQTKELKKKFPNAIYIRPKQNLGFTGGCNLGAKEAMKLKISYLFFLNNDAVLEKDAIEKLVKKFKKQRNPGIIAPQVIYPDGRIWSQGSVILKPLGLDLLMGKEHNGLLSKILAKLINKQTPDWIAGTAVLIGTDLFKKVGMFTENYFGYCEDKELCLRIKRLNGEIEIEKDAKVIHEKSASFSNPGQNSYSPIQAYLKTRNSIWIIKNNYSGVIEAALIAQRVFISSIFEILFFVRSFASLFAYFEGLLHGLTGQSNQIKYLKEMKVWF